MARRQANMSPKKRRKKKKKKKRRWLPTFRKRIKTPDGLKYGGVKIWTHFYQDRTKQCANIILGTYRTHCTKWQTVRQTVISQKFEENWKMYHYVSWNDWGWNTHTHTHTHTQNLYKSSLSLKFDIIIIYCWLIAQSTAQGHRRAFHKFKFCTKVEYNTKHAHYIKLKHTNIIQKVVPSVSVS